MASQRTCDTAGTIRNILLKAALVAAGLMPAVAFGVAIEARPAPKAGPVLLVEEGRARSAILAGENNSPSERFAAEELQKFLEEMSGAKLPIVALGKTQAEGQTAASIVVGKTTAEARHKGLELDKLGTEGFVIKTIGGDLVLAGRASQPPRRRVHGHDQVRNELVRR